MLNEVSDLRELTTRMGVALGMEGVMGQGRKLRFLPSCCVAERKSALSLVPFSSFYSKETVAQRECSQSCSWDSNPDLTNSKAFFSPLLPDRFMAGKADSRINRYNSMRDVPKYAKVPQ